METKRTTENNRRHNLKWNINGVAKRIEDIDRVLLYGVGDIYSLRDIPDALIQVGYNLYWSIRRYGQPVVFR